MAVHALYRVFMPHTIKSYLCIMAGSKKPVKKARANKYDEKLAVKGTFLEIMKAASKNANDKSAPKKKKGE